MRFHRIVCGALLALFFIAASAQTASDGVESTLAASAMGPTPTVSATLETLDSFVDLRNAILADIKSVNKQIAASQSDNEKQELKAQLDKLESDLRAITRNFESIHGVAGPGDGQT